MMSKFALTSRRAARIVAALALAFVATACGDDDPIAVEKEPETTSIVVSIAGTGVMTQTLTWNTGDGVLSAATINLPTNATRTVTAQFLRANGSADPAVTAEDFRLDFNVTSGSSVTITRNGNLGATFTTGSTTGNTVLQMKLVHIEENHDEYTSNPVTFQIM